MDETRPRGALELLDQLYLRADLDFSIHRLEVVAYGVLTDEETPRDARDAVTRYQQLSDLRLTGREQIELRARGRSARIDQGRRRDPHPLQLDANSSQDRLDVAHQLVGFLQQLHEAPRGLRDIPKGH